MRRNEKTYRFGQELQNLPFFLYFLQHFFFPEQTDSKSTSERVGSNAFIVE